MLVFIFPILIQVLLNLISGEGKQSSLVNRGDSAESGQKASVNNNYQGNHTDTFYVSDSQMIVTKGRKL